MASVQKKDKEGKKWLLIASNGFEGGKRIRETKIFYGTHKKALDAAVLFENEVKRGKYCGTAKDYTFRDFVDAWIKDYSPQLAPKTLHWYQQMLNDRILPRLGDIRMDKLNTMTLNRFFADLANPQKTPRGDKKWVNEEMVPKGIDISALKTRKKKKPDGKNFYNEYLINVPGPISPQTQKHYYSCVSTILSTAVEWKIIVDNPLNGVKPPRAEHCEVRCYNEEETTALLEVLAGEDTKHRVLVLLTISCGLREAEVMGLNWSDLDFDNNTLTVNQTSQYLPGKGIIEKSPKTLNSLRTIAVPESVMDLLKQYRIEWVEHRLEVGDLWQNSDRLFTTWDGQPGYPEWPGNWLSKFLKRNGLPHTTFHSLRHLSATLLLKEGVNLKEVSSRLGHADIRTTGNLYCHALESVDRKAADAMNTLLTTELVSNDDTQNKNKN